MSRRIVNTKSTGMDLNSQLDAYEATSAANGSTHWKANAVNWSIYAAAAGSAMALTTSLTASIIYSGPQNAVAVAHRLFAIYSRASGFHNIDIDGQGNSFNIHVVNIAGSFGPYFAFVSLDPGKCVEGRYGAICTNNGAHQMLGSGGNLRRLASGEVISSGQPGFGEFNNLLREHALRTFPDSRYSKGTWPEGQTAFAGVKFTERGETHFGWIRLKFNARYGEPNVIGAIDWAYNDVAGEPIRAGQTSSVAALTGKSQELEAQIARSRPEPTEPTNKALALLSAGSLGLLAWRRRRSSIL